MKASILVAEKNFRTKIQVSTGNITKVELLFCGSLNDNKMKRTKFIQRYFDRYQIIKLLEWASQRYNIFSLEQSFRCFCRFISRIFSNWLSLQKKILRHLCACPVVFLEINTNHVFR